MKYKIQYNYETGNSFGHENREEFLELEFNDLNVAEANLDRINEHYQQYKLLDNCNISVEQLLASNEKKDWFVKLEKIAAYMDDPKQYSVIEEKDIEKYIAKGYSIMTIIDRSIAQNCIILYTDNGKPYQFWAPWCGYFETLNWATITNDFKKYIFK